MDLINTFYRNYLHFDSSSSISLNTVVDFALYFANLPYHRTYILHASALFLIHAILSFLAAYRTYP